MLEGLERMMAKAIRHADDLKKGKDDPEITQTQPTLSPTLSPTVALD